MTTYLITAHPSSLEWMLAQSFPGVNLWMPLQDFDPNQVQAGDQVIGTLPAHLADAVCERGARCFNLVLDAPQLAPGEGLLANAIGLSRQGPRLEEYTLSRQVCEE